jgi:hypothetical protein
VYQILKHPKGWEYSDFVVIDGVMYEHGDRFGGGNATSQAVQVNGQSTVFGHHHAHAGNQFVASRTKRLFGMNVGCLIDHNSYGMAYAEVSRLYQTLGAGVVLNGIPLWEPMVPDAKHRWAATRVLGPNPSLPPNSREAEPYQIRLYSQTERGQAEP